MKKAPYLICLFLMTSLATTIDAQKISVSKTVYSPKENIYIEISGYPENEKVFVNIVIKESGKEKVWYGPFYYNNGVHELPPVPVGEYEVQEMINSTPDKAGYQRVFVVSKRTYFKVVDKEEDEQIKVTTNKEIYAPGEKIIVTCSGFEKYLSSWICLAKKSDPISSNGRYGNPRNGKVEYSSSIYGDYEIRAYLKNDHNLLKKVSIRIGNEDIDTKVSTKKIINPEESIFVEFSGFPGNWNDKIYIVPANSTDFNAPFTPYEYLKGQQKGKIRFSPKGPGDYEVLGIFNNEDIVRARFSFKVGYASDLHKKAFYISELNIDDLEKRSKQLPYKAKEWRLTNFLKEEIKKRELILEKIRPLEEDIKQLNKEISDKGNGIESIKEKLADIETKENRHKRYLDISEQLTRIGSKRRELELIVSTGQKEREKSTWWNEREEKAQKEYEEKLKEIKEGELPGGYIFKLISEQKELNEEWQAYVYSQLHYDENYLKSTLEKKMKAIAPFITKEESVRTNFLNPLLNQLQDKDNTIRDIEFELSNTKTGLYNEQATPTIEEINVISEGKIIFNAVWNVRPEVLALKNAMEELKAARDQAAIKKRDTYLQFTKAADEALKAGLVLSGGKGGLFGGGKIANTALKNAGIETLYYFIDIGLAFEKGGLIGSFSEALKKLWEANLPAAEEYYGSSEENSIAAQLNKELGIQIRDPHSVRYYLSTSTKILVDRTIKTTITGPVSKPMAHNIFNFFGELENVIKPILKETENLNTIESDWKRILDSKNFQLKAWDVGQKIGLDITKLYWQTKVAESEKEAWYDYFYKDAKARPLFVLYQVAATNFWKADSTCEANLEKYQQVLDIAQRDPNGFQITENEPFYSKDILEISMKIKDDASVYKERISLNGKWSNFNKSHQFLFYVPGNWLSDVGVDKKISLYIQRRKKTDGWAPQSYEH